MSTWLNIGQNESYVRHISQLQSQKTGIFENAINSALDVIQLNLNFKS
jgi:hypothetical protein